jgi:hypothetical protein
VVVVKFDDAAPAPPSWCFVGPRKKNAVCDGVSRADDIRPSGNDFKRIKMDKGACWIFVRLGMFNAIREQARSSHRHVMRSDTSEHTQDIRTFYVL